MRRKKKTKLKNIGLFFFLSNKRVKDFILTSKNKKIKIKGRKKEIKKE